jgi:hypothetical protein
MSYTFLKWERKDSAFLGSMVILICSTKATGGREDAGAIGKLGGFVWGADGWIKEWDEVTKEFKD